MGNISCFGGLLENSTDTVSSYLSELFGYVSPPRRSSSFCASSAIHYFAGVIFDSDGREFAAEFRIEIILLTIFSNPVAYVQNVRV